jgi:hypothetical protein
MSTVQEIESAIQQSKPHEIHEVADWLLALREEIWDREIEADAKFVRLDKLIATAKANGRLAMLVPSGLAFGRGHGNL